MNREIKFEYGFESVNGVVKKTYYLHEIPNIKEKCDVWNTLPIKYVRQYTGLKDKNGVEIYEGDIVIPFSLESKDYESIIVYEFNQFGIKGKSLYWNWDSKQIEVIGNIYENRK